jgi:DNA polymerase III epsilon subunit-like protein
MTMFNGNSLSWNIYSIAVVDIEGNGQRPPEIVELAVVPIDGGTVGSYRSWLVRPPRPITALVTERVHGISNEDVADAPEWAEVAHEVSQALEGRILVAHNAGVERKLLARYLPGYQPPHVVDTLALARKYWPTLPGHGLSELIEARGIRVTSRYGQRHRAGYDAYATAQLFLQLAHAAGGLDALLPDTAAKPGLW